MNETNDAITSNATLEGFELPLMPLREVVMSPHSIMPLLVGREASIKAIESAVNDYGKRICLVTQRPIRRISMPLAWSGACSST